MTYHPAQAMTATLKPHPGCPRCQATLLYRDLDGSVSCVTCGHEVQPPPRKPLISLEDGTPVWEPGGIWQQVVSDYLREHGTGTVHQIIETVPEPDSHIRVLVGQALAALQRAGRVRIHEVIRTGPKNTWTRVWAWVE